MPIASITPGTDGAASTEHDLLTIPEAADRLRVSRSTLYRILRTHEIETVRIIGRRLIPVDAIDGYIRDRRTA